MANILHGIQGSASSVAACSLVGGSARRSSRSSQQNSKDMVCASSQFCLQGISGASVSRLHRASLGRGFLDGRNHAQLSCSPRLKESWRLSATASEELQSVASDVAVDANASTADSILAFPGDVPSPTLELSGSESTGAGGDLLQYVEPARVGQDSTQAVESTSAFVSGDLGPSLVDGASSTPSTALPDVGPSLLDGANSTPSTALPETALDALNSTVEDGSAGDTILSAKERYLRALGGGLEQSDNDNTFDVLQNGQSDVFGTLESAKDNVVAGLQAAQDTASTSLTNLVDTARAAVESVGSTVKNTYVDFNGALVKLVKTSTGSAEKTVDGVHSSVDNGLSGVSIDFTSPFRVGTPANDALKEVIIVVKEVTGKAIVTAEYAITKVYVTTKDILPEDIQAGLTKVEGKVSQLAEPLDYAINQVLTLFTDAEKAVGLDPDNPVIPVILVVGSSLFLGLGYVQGRYGGYSGDLLPKEALELIKKEGNAVLVDIRPQEIREAQGIPDLRRSARSKFASVEVVKVEKSLRGQLRNANEIDSILTAAVIRNLRNVDRDTQVIVLDEDGNQSKEIARALRRSGSKRQFRVSGGYEAWAAAGLRSKEEGPVSPFTILKEETEAIVEEVKPTVAGVLAAAFGLATGIYAILEWEKSLQFIGVLGLATTIYIRVESYDSVEDAKADIKFLQKPFKYILEAILWIVGQVQPKKLQLATSPASSAVQGRMLQAAAKHGAVASEQEEASAEAEDSPMDESTQTHSTTLQDSQ